MVRVDWSVPQNDYSRIEASLETIKYVKDHNGTSVVMSHFGREGESIKPIIELAKQKFPELEEGVEFLENLRMDKREEENNQEFAKELAAKGDIYVNEAFSVSHRAHASIVSLPKLLPSYAGINFLKEVENLSKAFNPLRPFLLILGGAKFETKLPLVEKFLDIADEIFIGGAMVAEAKKLPISSNPKIIFPADPEGALDAGEETIENLKFKIENSKFILWNGPLGKFEEGYTEGTEKLAKILAESDADVIVGGGDTLAAIKNLNLKEKFTWVSTAGGAMLDFLANGTLVGIEALDTK